MARAKLPSVQRSIRLSPELWARVDARAAEMSAANPSMVFTGVDAIRDALERTLPPLPEGAVPAASKPAKRTAKNAKRKP